MRRSHIALTTAAALAAAAALSACAGEGPKPWPSASPAAVAKPTRWVSDLPAQPVPADRRDTSEWQLRFDSVPAPGVGIWEQGTDNGCTLGPVVAPTMSETSRGYLTAGHCDSVVVADAVIYADANRTDARRVGVYTGTVDEGYRDSTALWVTGTAAPASIAGRPVAGLLTKAAVKELPTNTAVCVDGAVSGVICGPLSEADGDRIQIEVPTREGDSGAAVFLVSDTGAATLVGQVKKSSTRYTYATFLESALADQHAKLVVDRSAATAAKGDPRYSDQTVPAS